MMRFPSLAELRQALQRVRGAHAEAAANDNSDVIDAIALLSGGHAGDAEAARERWLLRGEHGDVGPYSTTRVEEMLRADEIDEYAMLVDLDDDSVQSLVDTPTFTDLVMDYLPERQRRRMAQDERREELKKTVKRGSLTSVIAGTLAVVVGAAVLYQLRPVSPELPLSDAVAPLTSRFQVGEVAFTELAHGRGRSLVSSMFRPRRPRRSPRQARRPVKP